MLLEIDDNIFKDPDFITAYRTISKKSEYNSNYATETPLEYMLTMMLASIMEPYESEASRKEQIAEIANEMKRIFKIIDESFKDDMVSLEKYRKVLYSTNKIQEKLLYNINLFDEDLQFFIKDMYQLFKGTDDDFQVRFVILEFLDDKVINEYFSISNLTEYIFNILPCNNEEYTYKSCLNNDNVFAEYRKYSSESKLIEWLSITYKAKKENFSNWLKTFFKIGGQISVKCETDKRKSNYRHYTYEDCKKLLNITE